LLEKSLRAVFAYVAFEYARAGLDRSTTIKRRARPPSSFSMRLPPVGSASGPALWRVHPAFKNITRLKC